MNNALILHGKPTEERYNNPDLPKPHEANWLPWIKTMLAAVSINSEIPQFPRPYFPVYDAWEREFETYPVDADTGIVAFSAGADFILRWLSGNTQEIERLVLVAPWRDTKRKYGEFSDYTLDSNLSRRVGRISIFSSSDDSAAITANVQQLTQALPQAHHIQLHGLGHFMIGNNMSGPEFPELFEELMRPTLG